MNWNFEIDMTGILGCFILEPNWVGADLYPHAVPEKKKKKFASFSSWNGTLYLASSPDQVNYVFRFVHGLTILCLCHGLAIKGFSGDQISLY